MTYVRIEDDMPGNTWDRGITPLAELSEDIQEEVRLALLSPSPPPRWIGKGPSDSPRPLAYIQSRSWYEWHLARGRNYRGAKGRRESIPKNLRLTIIARDGRICRLCGDFVGRTSDIDVDHIVPVARGGRTEAVNLQVTHESCNRRKGAGPWLEPA